MKNKTTYEYKAENKKWGGFIYQMNNFDGMLPPRAICDEKEKDDFLEGLHNGKYFFAEDLRKPKYYKIKSKKHINIFTDKNFSNSRRDLVHLQYSKRNDFKNLPYDDFPTQKFNSDLLNIHLVNEKNLIAEGWGLDFYSKINDEK